MDYITELATTVSKHSSIIEATVAAKYGISNALLYKL